MKTNRKFLQLVFVVAAFMISSPNVWAQVKDPGSAALDGAAKMVTGYFVPAVNLIYAIAAVLGLIGGIKVYSKFSSGDPDTSKTAASWAGACVFLIVAATVLQSFFLS